MIDSAFLDWQLNASTIGLLPLLPQRMPHAAYVSDLFRMGIAPALPLFMTLAWLYTVALTVKSVVWEKEQRLSALLYCNGLAESTHWLSWVLMGWLITLPSVIAITALLLAGDVAGYVAGLYHYFCSSTTDS
jgi:hypothetical protein